MLSHVYVFSRFATSMVVLAEPLILSTCVILLVAGKTTQLIIFLLTVVLKSTRGYLKQQPRAKHHRHIAIRRSGTAMSGAATTSDASRQRGRGCNSTTAPMRSKSPRPSLTGKIRCGSLRTWPTMKISKRQQWFVSLSL